MPSSYKAPEHEQLPPAENRAVEERQLPPGHEPKQLPPPDGQGRGEDERAGARRGEAPRRLLWIVVAAGILLLALLAFGLLRHYRQQKSVQASARQQEESLPIVNVIKVRRSPADTSQMLPGNMTPLTEAYIYARANGYVRKRLADIGDHVKKGQLLAQIEAPDLDQQVEQARAAVAQAEHQVQQADQQLANTRSQEELARVTWDRYRVLLQPGAVARQEADQQYTSYRSATAAVGAAEANLSAARQNVEANRANLNRVLALQGYEDVRAPFSGVITARNFDVGALVGGSGAPLGGSNIPLGGTQVSGSAGNAGATGNPGAGASAGGALSATSASGSAGEMFRMAQIGTLRILVNVPQESASFIHVGEHATVFAQGYPNDRFEGRVTRTSSSIDLITRTLLTEVDVTNPNQMLLPGTYSEVQIENVRPHPPLLVPGDTIMAGPNGLQVAVLAPVRQSQDNDQQRRQYPPDARQIHVVDVQVGRDYGTEIEIVTGLKGDEYVVVNPSDVVQEAAVVKPQNTGGGEGSQPRRAPTERTPTVLTSPITGQADSGGRGASQPPPGAQNKGGQPGKPGQPAKGSK